MTYGVTVSLGDGATARLCFHKKPTEAEIEDARQGMMEMRGLLKAKGEKKQTKDDAAKRERL